MGIETFPEIENFQKLPHQVIVKGGSSSFSEDVGAELRGIVINNIGQPVRDIRAHVVIFDEKKIPVMSASAAVSPDVLPQGEIGAFAFRIKEYPRQIRDYHLYATWKFDHRE